MEIYMPEFNSIKEIRNVLVDKDLKSPELNKSIYNEVSAILTYLILAILFMI